MDKYDDKFCDNALSNPWFTEGNPSGAGMIKALKLRNARIRELEAELAEVIAAIADEETTLP
jgi:hypothetical protein